MKKILSVICLLTAAALITGCSKQNEKITRLSDLEGKIVAVLASHHDPVQAQAFTETLAGVKFKEMRGYTTFSPAIAALKSNHADAVLAFAPMISFYMSQDNQFGSINLPPHGTSKYHMAVRSSDTELLEKINAAITSMNENGILKDLGQDFITNITAEKLLSGKVMPNIPGASTLIVGLSGEIPPIDYVAADGKPAGYNVEFLALLSEMLQVNFELSVLPMESKFPALASRAIDIFFFHMINENAEEVLRTIASNNNISLSRHYYESDSLGFLVLK